MNVYKVTIDETKSDIYGGGMAVVAANSEQDAVERYMHDGSYAEYFYHNDITLTAELMKDTTYSGDVSDTSVLAECFYIE